MWTFHLDIIGDEFEFVPLNKDEFKLKTRKLSAPYSDSVTETEFIPFIDAKGLNVDELLYARFFDYLIDTQSTECYFIIRGDLGEVEYRGFFNGLDIETDNDNSWYKINHVADNSYTNIQSRKSINYNIYERVSRGIVLDRPGTSLFESDIKGCISLQSILTFFTKELIGDDYEFSSSFLNDDTNPINNVGYLDRYNDVYINPFKYLYLTQSSNVIVAVDNASYDQAEVYEIDWQTLSNDLYYTFDIVFRIDSVNKLLIVENRETDIESRQSGYDFNQAKFAKFFSNKNKYTYNKVEVPNSETWTNTYDNERFAEQSLIYDIATTRRAEELNKDYNVSMMFDLLGVSTNPDSFPNTGSFLIATNGNSEILYEISDYLVQKFEQAQPGSLIYLILNNAFKTNYINLTGFTSSEPLPGLPLPVSLDTIEYTVLLDDFIISSGDEVSMDFYGYVKSKYMSDIGSKSNVVNDDFTFGALGGGQFFSIFLIDGNVQNDPEENTYASISDFFVWSGGMSNIMYFDNETIRNWPKVVSGIDTFIQFNNLDRIKFNAVSSTNRCKLIMASYPSFYSLSEYGASVEGTNTYRPPIDTFVLDYKIYIDGVAVVYNSPLQWSYLIENYHRNERFLNEALFSYNNKQIELNNKKRLRILNTVSPAVADYEEFDSRKILKTPFGDDAEVLSSTYNPISNKLDLQLAYDQDKRPFTGNKILEMYFPEMQGLPVIDNVSNKITVVLSVGADITSIDPTFRLSQKATINKTGVQDFTNPVNYLITAENGTQRIYEITILTNTPQFTLNLNYDGVPNRVAYIRPSNSSVATWRSDNIEPVEVIGNNYFINKASDPSSVSINIPDFRKVILIVLSHVSDSVCDLSQFDGLTQIGLYDGAFDSVKLPVSSNTFNSIVITRCSITSLDLSPLTGDSSGCTMLLNDNNLSGNTVDSMLYSIALKGWAGLNIIIDGNNEPPVYSIRFIGLSGGVDYVAGEIITPTNGSGVGLQIEVTSVDGLGSVLTSRILSSGSGYSTTPTSFTSDGIGSSATISALTSYEYLTSTLSSSVTVTT